MKKNILILVGLFFIMKTQLNAQIITTLENLENNNLIENENRKIINSNIEWNKKGDYVVEFYDEINNKVVFDNVMIRDEITLENGINIYQDFNLKYNGIKYDIQKVLFIDEDNYYIIGSKMIDINKKVPVVNYYEKDILVNSYTYSNVKSGTFKDICFTNKGIVVIGEYIPIDSFTNNIIILELSNSFQENNYKIIRGDRDGIARKIFTDNKKIFFISESISRYHDYNNNDLVNNIYVNMMDMDFENHQYLSFRNNQSSVYYDSFYDKNNVFLFMRFVGWGSFVSNNVEFDALIKINCELFDYDYISLENYNFLNNKKIIKINNRIDLFSYDSNNASVFSFLENLDFYKKYSFNIVDERANISSLDMSYNDNIVLCGTIVDKITGDKKISIKLLSDQYQLIHEDIKNTSYLDVLNCYFVNNSILFSGNTINKNGDILPYTNRYFYLKIREVNKENSINIKKYYDVYINEIKNNVELINYSLSSQYGNIIYNSKYIDSYLEIYLPYSIFTMPKINIEDGQTYDLGKTLEFNGVAYLNNVEIDKNYSIDKEGFYVLKLKSINNEYMTYTFSIKKLIDDLEEGLEVIDNMLIDYLPDNYTEVQHACVKIEKPQMIEKSSNIIYVFVSVLIISFGIGFLIPEKFLRGGRSV